MHDNLEVLRKRLQNWPFVEISNFVKVEISFETRNWLWSWFVILRKQLKNVFAGKSMITCGVLSYSATPIVIRCNFFRDFKGVVMSDHIHEWNMFLSWN